jgi:DNA-binding LacI/PurR family transcriptional regulator
MPTMIKGNRIPLYHQVAQTLKQRVRTGVYQTGKSLPSVRNLSEEFGVSLNVVQQAVYHLEKDGIVVTHHGKGMTVKEDKPCEHAAIIFGFIHPYLSSMGFYQQVLACVGDAFAERSNFAVVHSSKDDPVREREAAEHLIANGVKGIMVWPTNNDPNGEYFTALSRKVPVVLVDRLLAGAELPTIVHDYETGGQEMCDYLFEKMKKQRILVLVDNLRISGYEEMTQGFHQAANRQGRPTDITIVQLPIQDILSKINTSDFSGVDHYAPYIEKLLTEGGYDAVFCTQDELIEYVMVDTGVMDKFPSVQLATLRGTGANARSRKYRSLGLLDLYMDNTQLVSRAADIIQDWVLSRQPSKQQLRLKMELRFEKINIGSSQKPLGSSEGI